MFFAFSRRMSAKSFSMSLAVSELVGSSSTRMRQSNATARAISTSCCCAMEIFRTGTSSEISSRPTSASAAAALAEVGLVDISLDVPVRKISIAQQQLVEIARAVALDCRILVLDEPTSSLTAKDIEKLFALISRLKTKEISVIYISHFLEEVQAISDRSTALRD